LSIDGLDNPMAVNILWITYWISRRSQWRCCICCDCKKSTNSYCSSNKNYKNNCGTI